MAKAFANPFRPGAGHMPPYLAGREDEKRDFRRLLAQGRVMENLILTGLRGVGKTVLLDALKPIAVQEGWLWVGTDMSESSSISEDNLAVRILTDISVATSALTVRNERAVGDYAATRLGFVTGRAEQSDVHLTYQVLMGVYRETPGLVEDKLRAALQYAADAFAASGKPPRGVIFAYDEAQNLSDHAADREYPLSLLLSVFQSLQRRQVPYLLALTGLPTLFPKLVETRTFAERMFHVVTLDRLTPRACRDAILRPIRSAQCPVQFADASVNAITAMSGGYPYFIQFICREVYDLAMQQAEPGPVSAVPTDEVLRKLDSDFFVGRWAKATDRQRELLSVIAHLPSAEGEFTVQELVRASRSGLRKAFSSSHASQMLATLCAAGLVYRNRYGKYSFAVPLLGQFIKRQLDVGAAVAVAAG